MFNGGRGPIAAPPAAQGGVGPPIIPAPRPPRPPAAQGGAGPPIIPAPHAAYAAQLRNLISASHAAPSVPRYGITAAQHNVIQQLLGSGNHSLSEGIRRSGGGLSFASIAPWLVPGYNVLHGLSYVPGVLGNAAKDLTNMPSDTLKGIEQLAPAMAHDIGHFSGVIPDNSHGNNGSQLLPMLENAWKQSVTSHLVKGDLSGALSAFGKHPVYGAQELMAGVGGAGRLAGALGRSGLVGDRMAAMASTAREGRPLTEGLPLDVQHYSPNLFTKGLQTAIERNPGIQEAFHNLTRHGVERQLVKRVDELHATNDARAQHEISGVVQQLKDSMPTNKAAAGVVPHAVMGIAGPKETFVTGLERVLTDLKAHESNLTGKELALNQAHQANIQTFLADPSLEAVWNARNDFVTRTQSLDRALAEHGLIDSNEAARRALKPFVESGQMPGVRLTRAGESLPTPRSLDARGAYQDYQSAAKDIGRAQTTHNLSMAKVRADTAREIAQARERLQFVKGQQRQAYGVLLGRRGGDVPLKPYEVDRIQGYLDRTHQAEADLKAAQQHAAAQRAEQKQYGLDAISAAKNNAQVARDQYNVVHKPFRNEKASGIVRDMGGGTGQAVATQEILDHMRDAGIDPTAYIKMNSPQDKANWFSAKFRGSRGGSRGKAFTGSGQAAGIWEPGAKGLARSQMGQMARLQRAISNDQFVKTAAVKLPDGTPRYFDQAGAKTAADHYNATHDVQVEALPAHPGQIDELANARIKGKQGLAPSWQNPLESAAGPRDRFVLAPKVMVDRYLEHLNVDNTRSNWGGYINRKFRNTVLPTSPKWFAGNMIEAGLRGALKGAGPGDWRLADKVINQMRDLGRNDQAAHLERMATGGLHYGMQERLNRENLGLEGTNAPHPAIAAVGNLPVLKQLGQGYHAYTERVFALNRRLESTAEKAVLGTHMRRQMQEFSGSWLKALGSQQQYIEKLAHGYADPQLAADAGRYIHDTLGQYDRFSPAMRKFTRSIAPFSPWYLNAAKFVYYTLPMKHPLTQAVMLQTAKANEKDWAAHHNVPQDKFFGIPVGDLLSAANTGPGSYLNLGRYTPEGAFTSGPTDYAVNMFVPQLSGAIHNMLGQDPFGQKLVDSHGQQITDTGQKFLTAVSDLLGGLSGPTNSLHRIFADQGSTPYNSEKLWDLNPRMKPDTHHGLPGILGGVERTLYPFFPTYLKKNVGAGSGPAVGGKVPVAAGSGPAVGGKVPSVGGR